MKPNKLSKRLMTLALSMSVSLSSIEVRAADDACTPVVKACDRALADQDRIIDLKTRAITAQDNIIKVQDTHITELEKNSGSSIFKSPLLYVLVGAVVGGYLVGRAK